MGTRSKRRQLACFDAPAMSAGMTEHPGSTEAARCASQARRGRSGYSLIRLPRDSWTSSWAEAMAPLPLIESESRNASESGIGLFRDRRHIRLHALRVRRRTRSCPGHHRRHHGHSGQGVASAVPPRQVRRRRGLRLRARRQGRWIAPAGFDRTGLFCVPQAAPQHQAGQHLRVPGLQPDAEPRRQVRGSSRRVHPAKDVRSRRARRPGRDPGPPPPQERSRQDVRPACLCALFRRLRASDGDRPRGAGLFKSTPRRSSISAKRSAG